MSVSECEGIESNRKEILPGHVCTVISCRWGKAICNAGEVQSELSQDRLNTSLNAGTQYMQQMKVEELFCVCHTGIR